MELTGLILALIAILFVGYAVPIWSKRRYAHATSRQNDRFSEHLTLLEVPVGRGDADYGPSSRPILQNATAPLARRGDAMSERELGATDSSSHVRSKTASTDVRTAQEYSALRARRAAYLSREKVAAKRRMVTAGVGALAAVVFAVLGATGVLGWLWMLLPVGFLVATLVASAVAGERTKKLMDADDDRMAELRTSIHRTNRGTHHERTNGSRSAPQSTSDRGPSPAEAHEESRGPISSSIPQSSVTSVSADPSAETELRAAYEDERASSVKRVSGRGWNYAPLPSPSYSRREKITARTVHADTDIVSVRPLASVSVPGRPTRATAPVVGDVIDASTASNPTFKFDLDAVLDQRRAQ